MSDRYDVDALGNFQPKRPSKRRTFGSSKTSGIVLTAVLTLVSEVVMPPLIVSIGTTYLHRTYPGVPALGIWASLWVCIIVQSVARFARPTKP